MEMSQVNIVSEKSLTDKKYYRPAPDVLTTAELYERTGFWFIFQIFRYFGFRLQESPRGHSCFSRRHIGLILTFTLAAVAVTCYLSSCLVWKSNGSLNIENASFFAAIAFAYILTILNFSIGLTNAWKYCAFLKSVSSAVNLIPEFHKKQKTVLSIRRSSYICLIFILFGVLSAVFPTMYQTQMWEEDLDGTTSICLVISSLLNFVWMATVTNFYLFSNTFLFIMCSILSQLIDIYLEAEDRKENAVDDAWLEPEKRIEDEMNEKLTNHRKLSALVKQANSIFSHFLLISLSMEIVICISFIKFLSIKNGIFSVGVYSNTFHVILMVGKAIACANVNDKLKSSLRLKKLSSSRNYFESYILYQTDQQNNRAEITYGNIFPVTKTFIFTIAGTALTYALVLQGV